MNKQILGAQFNKTNNNPPVKESNKLSKIQKVVPTNFTQQINSYFHQYTKLYITNQNFKQIIQMINERSNSIIKQINNGDILMDQQNINQIEKIKLIKPIEEPVKKMSVTIDVAKYKDDENLPISQNHQYWSYKHNKAKEIKQYVKKLHEQEQKFKKQMEEKRNEQQRRRNLLHQKQLYEVEVAQQRRKNEMRNKITNKIKQMEQNAKIRKQRQIAAQNLYQSLKIQKPLYEVLQQKYIQTYQIPLLKQRKIKLQKLRKIRTPSIGEIKQHNNRYEQYRQHHIQNSARIFNSPLKVSFKSDYHKDFSLQNKSQTDIAKQLYDKKIKYAKDVKVNFKPIISEKLAQEITDRLNQKKKRKKRRKIRKNQQDQQQQEISQQQEVQIEEQQSQDQNSQNGHKNHHLVLDPYLKKRNSLGRKYLQYIRNLKKKSKEQIQKEENEKIKEQKQEAEKNKFHKINYLQQFKNNKPINQSKRNNFQNWQKDLHNSELNQIEKKNRIFIKAQIIDQKAHMKDIELNHIKLGELQKLQKTKEVDSQYIDAIKAKLAIMQG